MSKAYQRLKEHGVFNAMQDGTLENYKGAYILTGSGDELDVDRVVTDLGLASVINVRGLVQVGDTVYKVTDQAVSRTHVQYVNELQAGSSHVLSIPCTHRVRASAQQRGARKMDQDRHYNQEYEPAGLNKRRFKSNAWAINYWFPYNYWSTGLEILHQRKNWYGWGAIPTNDWNVYVFSKTDNTSYPNPLHDKTETAAEGTQYLYRFADAWTTNTMGEVTLQFDAVIGRNGGGMYHLPDSFVTKI